MGQAIGGEDGICIVSVLYEVSINTRVLRLPNPAGEGQGKYLCIRDVQAVGGIVKYAPCQIQFQINQECLDS